MNNKGFIMAMALIVVAALSLMIGAFSLTVIYRNQIAMKYVNSVKAYNLAAAGIEYSNLISTETAELSLDDSGNKAKIAWTSLPDGFSYNVSSTATINGVTRTINSVYDYRTGDGVMVKWQ